MSVGEIIHKPNIVMATGLSYIVHTWDLITIFSIKRFNGSLLTASDCRNNGRTNYFGVVKSAISFQFVQHIPGRSQNDLLGSSRKRRWRALISCSLPIFWPRHIWKFLYTNWGSRLTPLIILFLEVLFNTSPMPICRTCGHFSSLIRRQAL